MKRVILFFLMSSLPLVACSGGGGTPAPDSANVPIVSDNFAVSAEGATVSVGDVLARLENSELLASQVAQAEAELLNA